jgi:hypothetical protein
VEAGPPSAGYRLSKFAQRHRMALATTVAFALMLVAAAAGSTYLAVRAIQAQSAAKEARAKSELALAETKDAQLKTELALKESEESRSLANRRLEQTIKAQEKLALAHNNLGRAFVRLGDRAAAADENRKALLQYQALAADHPDARDYAHGVAVAHNNLGGALVDLGDRNGEADEFRKALEGYAALAEDHPNVFGVQQWGGPGSPPPWRHTR